MKKKNEPKIVPYEKFREYVLKHAENCRETYPEWRKGQSVFNVLDIEWGLARTVQFEKGVDCFYRDDQIEPFIEAAYEVFKECVENSQKD